MRRFKRKIVFGKLLRDVHRSRFHWRPSAAAPTVTYAPVEAGSNFQTRNCVELFRIGGLVQVVQRSFSFRD